MNGIRKLLKNPAFGLIPFLVFSFLVGRINLRLALLISSALAGTSFFVVKKQSRLIYDLSLITFVLSFLFSFFITPRIDEFRTFVLIEIIFVLSLIVSRLSRSKIIFRMARNPSPVVKNYLSESFRVAFQTQYGLSIHLLFVLAFFIFSSPDAPFLNRLAVKTVFQIILITIIVMEMMRLRMLDRQLKKEEWLPVVDDHGDVKGRIAKSVSKDLKNKFMHPVVRIAVIYKGKIYLKCRDEDRLLDPGKLDYPFERFIDFNNLNPDEVVRNIIQEECKNENIPVRFLLKYVFENERVKRLIFLYVSDIEEEDLFNSMHLEGGKLWTESQIEENIGNNLFSECFELEYEYLENTILMVRHLKRKSDYSLKGNKKEGVS
ncbi:hypothetical protein [Anaerorudis cellulosivorans]|uniref:hypothetical protein n=1 Tax=Anaerorudis cellulosivorans TaxID=3397862 RepID=UPI00221F3298|nr:hypothetical protein [Seramator thermalis]MCW1736102.1 hypothetical protein [Seramator thermalis]